MNMVVERTLLPHDSSNAIAQLNTLVRKYMSPKDVKQVSQALQLALETCLGFTGDRAIPPLEHALAVSLILAQMHIDAIGVSAGLVFEAVDAERLPLGRVESVLGLATARVVGSMSRLNILERTKQSVAGGAVLGNQKTYEDRDDSGAFVVDSKKPRIREALRRQQAETVRKMFVAMADDPRVVVLKLAYRLHAMRRMCTPSYLGDLQEMLTLAQETLEIYAPLAGRLGMSRVESELQDLAFQVLEPEKCKWVRSIIEAGSKKWPRSASRPRSLVASSTCTVFIRSWCVSRAMSMIWSI
jgi:GTP pyrophosphokinase